MPFRYVLVAVLLQLLWSVVPSASKVVLEHLPVELYIALRWTIAGSIFLIIGRLRGRRLPVEHFPKLIAIGVLGYAGASMGTLYGLRVGGVVNFALLSAVSPLIMASVAVVALAERVTPRYLGAAAATVIGLVLLVRGKHDLAGFSVAWGAAAFVLGGYLCEAIPFVWSSRLKEKMALPDFMAMTQLSAAALMWGVAVGALGQGASMFRAPPIAWAGILYVSIASCVICYGVLYWLLRRVPGHKLALFEGIHTLGAALLGVAFFGETFNGLMLAGALLLVAGLTIANTSAEDAQIQAREA